MNILVIVTGLVILIIWAGIEGYIKRFWNWVWTKSKLIKTRKYKDRKMLEGIKESLRYLLSYERFDPIAFQRIKDELVKAGNLAKELKSRKHKEIKKDLINYSKKEIEVSKILTDLTNAMWDLVHGGEENRGINELNRESKARLDDLQIAQGAAELLEKINEVLKRKKSVTKT